MPRLEGGTNKTSKIAMIIAGVVIVAGVAWYAMSSQNTSETSTAMPVPSASSPPSGSPPPPPDGNTAMSDESANATDAPATDATASDGNANEANATGGSSMDTNSNSVSSDGSTNSTTDTPGESSTIQSSDNAGVTMTPMGKSDSMSSSRDTDTANSNMPAAR